MIRKSWLKVTRMEVVMIMKAMEIWKLCKKESNKANQ